MTQQQPRAKRTHLQRPRGTQDIIGADMARWQHVEALCHKAFHQAGYQEIRTPIFEAAELFERGVGESTDIVNKEMYTFEKGDNRLSLRPEGTAGVVRSYIEQGMSRWPKPVKLYYMGPMFRYERPQAGRQRQFHQAGIELFGLDTPAADAEVIILAMRLFESLQLPNLALEINNIGTPDDRQQFKAELRQRLAAQLDSLCVDCQQRYQSNPLRMLDCKVPDCQSIYTQPELKHFLESDFTGPEAQAHFETLTHLLDAAQIPYRRNFYLVRGLDYYTKTVFEITSTHLGAQNAVCGGGRYNHLVEELGGAPTPAVGWGLGLERLLSLVKELPTPTLDYYLVTNHHATAFKLVDQIRAAGASVELDLSGKGFGKQLERATKSGAPVVLILGESEAQQQTITCKTLATSEQVNQSQSEFLATLNTPGRTNRVG